MSGGRHDPGKAHQGGDAMSYAEALEREVARRAAWRQRPDVVEAEARAARARQAREAEKIAGTPQGFIGPPNPYRPHRKG